jgi:predicted glutamine amidotransferase
MCRFLVYKGTDMLMADLLTRSAQSLIRQSYRARELEEPLNGDGFGIGWYADGDPVPSYYNFAVADDRYRMYPAARVPRAVIVASEPLTEHAEDWERVPRNHMVAIGGDFTLALSAL